MNSIIIGTAGHIDHGKTALIKELNGFEGDKLEEEKSRGITIDLSFSNLKNNDTNIAFIDVPGHEGLIKTMISGAYSLDAAMVVIAADDGIMPQTKEHIQILSILDVKSIIIVITKCDLVSRDILDTRQNEIKNYLKSFSNLEILRIFETSIKDKNSITELKDYLFMIKSKEHATDLVFHYYIDRVFSLKGIGQVVTGSLIGGSIKKGEKVYNYDTKKEYIVRSVQIHDNDVDSASSPNRVALNLSSSDTKDITKGQMLSKKGFFRAFSDVDCVMTNGEIFQNQNVVFCVGTKQLNARATICGEINALQFITFKFSKPVCLKFKENFVLLSNNRVIGGGKVLNSISEPMKKAQKMPILKALYENDFLLAFSLLKTFHKHGFGLISSYQRFALNHEEALEIALNLKDTFVDKKELNVYDKSAFNDISTIIINIFAKNKFAIISASSISNKISWASESLCLYVLNSLYENNKIAKNGSFFIDKNANLDEILESLDSKIYDILLSENFTPSAPYNIYDELEIDRVSGDNAMKKLTSSKKIIRLAHNLFITQVALSNILNLMREMIKIDGYINVTSIKDKLNLSRKYAIAYLEYLDKFDDIVKDGMDRKFK
ncbi:selenocysteine-specific translation elongation factor [Campylobacter sputorum]|uniref:selenocysteine-specific translation elongation factor n=1 Tax=Campylobacter sputorum TaxID=206 RepID=UPI001896962A|nr:selenocysteine-specific translation elongation factor [Campylobacter sp. RM11259]MBF6677574.1 selenocysteine-specific translation elongation factor [Campylobacter sp. RM11259]